MDFNRLKRGALALCAAAAAPLVMVSEKLRRREAS